MHKLILASPLAILFFLGLAMRMIGKNKMINSLGGKEYRALGLTAMIVSSALAVVGLIFF